MTTWVGDVNHSSTRRDGVGAGAYLTGGGESCCTLTRTPDGELWFVDQDPNGGDFMDAGYWLREVDPNGEVFTRGRIHLPGLNVNDSIEFDSIAASPDGRLFVAEEIWNLSANYRGPDIVEVQRDGTTLARVDPFTTMWPRPAGGLATGATGLLGADLTHVYLFSTDGGQTTLATSPMPGYADGLTDAGLFEYPSGLAMSSNGDVSFFDGLNHDVRLIHGDQLTTLAGPRPERRTVDGPGATARLSSGQGLAVAPSGVAYFSDANSIRRLDTNDVCATIVASDGGTSFDGPFTSSGLDPGKLAVTATGDILFSDHNASSGFAELSAAQVVTLYDNDAGVTAVAASEDGSFAWIDLPVSAPSRVWLQTASGVAQVLSTPTISWVTADPAGAFVIEVNSCLDHLDLDGGTSPLGPSPCSQPLAVAGSIDAAGNLYTISLLDNLVRRRSPDGGTDVVLELADHATDLAAEPSGSILILVPDALLRFHP